MPDTRLCMGCMRELTDDTVCPHCGFSLSAVQAPPFLPLGAVVGDRYLVGRMLEHNGEGATYIGYDRERGIVVNIREFLPEVLVKREYGSCELNVLDGCELVFSDCIQSFFELWRKLARMRGLSALICVIDIVEDYGTAYAVFEAVNENLTLREYLLDTPTGFIGWEQARLMFMPVLSTLGTLHTAGIIHRGISPNTLLVTADGKMVISGFSVGQARSMGGDLPPQLFAGYAPIEQYGFEGRQGPWTDIYAFAATLYRALIGSTPIEATSRATNDKLMIPAKFAELLPAYVVNGLVKALQIQPEDRTRSIEALRNDFSASPTAAAESGNLSTYTTDTVNAVDTSGEPEIIDPTKPKGRTGKKTALITFLISALICVSAFGAVLYYVYVRGSGDGKEESTSVGETTMLSVVKFVGQSAEILNDAYYTTYYDVTTEFVYSADVEQGIIVGQSIPEGTSFSSGERLKITIQVSKGIEYITLNLDDYVGKSLESVKAKLDSSGLSYTVNDTSYKNDALVGTIAAVIGGTLSGNELTAKSGDKITVYVYSSTTTAPPSTEATTAESTDVTDAVESTEDNAGFWFN